MSKCQFCGKDGAHITMGIPLPVSGVIACESCLKKETKRRWQELHAMELDKRKW